MKYAADPNNWIYASHESICQRDNGNYVNTNVQKCLVIATGTFTKANVSIVSDIIAQFSRFFVIFCLLVDYWFP